VTRGDEQRDEGTWWGCRCVGCRLSRSPGGLLELADQSSYLCGRVALVDDVAVLGQQHHPTDVVVADQFRDQGIIGDFTAGEGDQEELADFGSAGHLRHQLRHLVFLGVPRSGQRQGQKYHGREGQHEQPFDPSHFRRAYCT
jgi:hypothetical protein